jgi:uncharacterized protein (DUF427 family)
MNAIWNGIIIAESEKTINIEGNQYFPPESVNKKFLIDSDTHTVCHWKGTASYFNLDVDGAVNRDAAWYYSDPSSLADKIKGYVAFWKGVQVTQ